MTYSCLAKLLLLRYLSLPSFDLKDIYSPTIVYFFSGPNAYAKRHAKLRGFCAKIGACDSHKTHAALHVRLS